LLTLKARRDNWIVTRASHDLGGSRQGKNGAAGANPSWPNPAPPSAPLPFPNLLASNTATSRKRPPAGPKYPPAGPERPSASAKHPPAGANLSRPDPDPAPSTPARLTYSQLMDAYAALPTMPHAVPVSVLHF
jgi:hypothetical protein